MTVIPSVVSKAGEAFAAYLSAPRTDTAIDLSYALTEAGEPELSRLLLSFWTHGERVEPAPFWGPGAVCELSPHLPDGAESTLWFDPLEVAVSLLVLPTSMSGQARRLDVNPHFRIALAPASRWQLIGACAVADSLPVVPKKMCAEDAFTYAEMFGKSLCGPWHWRTVRAYEGDATASRVWGTSRIEIGDVGSSGLVAYYTWDEAVSDDFPASIEHGVMSDSEPLRDPCRTVANCLPGLTQSAHALARTF